MLLAKKNRLSSVKASRSYRRKISASVGAESINDAIRTAIENMNDDDLIVLWNEYTDENSGDDHVYYMEDFDEQAADLLTPIGFVECGQEGYVNHYHKYWWIDAYGYPKSFWKLISPESPVYIDELVDAIIDDNNAFYNDKIQEILDSFES